MKPTVSFTLTTSVLAVAVNVPAAGSYSSALGEKGRLPVEAHLPLPPHIPRQRRTPSRCPTTSTCDPPRHRHVASGRECPGRWVVYLSARGRSAVDIGKMKMLPRARSTPPLGNKLAVWPHPVTDTLPAAANVPVDGSYSSASAPPTTSTFPFSSSVAVWPDIAVPMLPVAANVPVAGSYNRPRHATGIAPRSQRIPPKPPPPATSTFPFGNNVAVWRPLPRSGCLSL